MRGEKTLELKKKIMIISVNQIIRLLREELPKVKGVQQVLEVVRRGVVQCRRSCGGEGEVRKRNE